MAHYTVYVGAGNTIDFRSMRAAKAFVRREWPKAVIGHDGDLSDGGDRTFCWADDAAAVNDDGANAIATIIRSDD
jgi:hypothetical protein